MEPTYYVSPQGHRQLVSTPTEAVRLKWRGWKPEAKPELPAPESQSEPASVTELPKPSRKKPKAPKPAA